MIVGWRILQPKLAAIYQRTRRYRLTEGLLRRAWGQYLEFRQDQNPEVRRTLPPWADVCAHGFLHDFCSRNYEECSEEEMAALMDAGVLDVMGPGMRVSADGRDPEGPCFAGTSTQIPGVRVRATVLIEARLPDIDVRRTADPLMRRLLRTGQARPYRIPGTPAAGDGRRGGADHETGGLAVTGRPYHLVDARGEPHPRRFAYGIPTESVHWVTAAGIRPGVGSVTLEDSDAIAAAVLAVAPACEVPVPVLPVGVGAAA